MRLASVVLAACTCAFAQPAPRPTSPPHLAAATTPPMGWNSYDYFGAAVTEPEFRAEVDFMKDHLLAAGWNTAVIDYLWFNPTGETSVHCDANGRPRDTLAMDAWGRLLPPPNRFPSATGGGGFAPIAAYVHSRGMKFGIHIMRGIPRQAYWLNTPVAGGAFRARDVADTSHVALCRWNDNMYGVDSASPGGQAYYNSLIDLYASWGVDFLKVDDIAAPSYRGGEIEMIRRAIDRCGRPIVLSLSPGDTPLDAAGRVVTQANMWRVSNDMWDNWKSLAYQFDRLDRWSQWIGTNHWPDADMLPLGHLSRGGRVNGPERMSHFTVDETTTLLSLWAIARSPLIMGGDLLTSPSWVLDMLRNRELIALDQQSSDNHQVFRDTSRAIWMARGPQPGTAYLAIFNIGEESRTIDVPFTSVPGLDKEYTVRDLWKHEDMRGRRHALHVPLGPHGAGLFKLRSVR